MLDPRDRALLLETLRPPDGYQLDTAIGTTYSLDLEALLMAPLAFTVFDWEDTDGRPIADPVVLLEALRRHADRLTVFCQAGRIAVPAQHQPLFGHLEASVVEVTARHPEGVFHPKVWALRFTPTGDTDRLSIVYRLLCLSRNLTFDRSWDTALVLEGELLNRTNAIAANHPLGAFFSALPSLATRPVSADVQTRADLIASEIRKVDFKPPDSFKSLVYHPMGINGRRAWPIPDRQSRCFVVSPFVSPTTLTRIADSAGDTVLVSSKEALDAVPAEVIDRFSKVFTMAQEAEPEVHAEDAAENRDEDSLRGLHAKLFVTERGHRTRVFTGSANATQAAFSRNVEFLVELEGTKKHHGIDSLLGSDSSHASLVDLLEPYSPPSEPVTVNDQQLEHLVNSARNALARATLHLKAEPAAKADEDSWHLSLLRPTDTLLDLPDGVTADCRPVTIAAEHALEAQTDTSVVADFGLVSGAALTTFVVVTLTAKSDGDTASSSFVLNLPLEGGPADRRERLLEQVLRDRSTVMRLLLLLLSDDSSSAAAIQAGLTAVHGNGHDSDGAYLDVPLFESLMKALHREPERLRRVQRLIDDLSSTEAGRTLLPEGFADIWLPIVTVLDD